MNFPFQIVEPKDREKERPPWGVFGLPPGPFFQTHI
jgi:hypothetical protein